MWKICSVDQFHICAVEQEQDVLINTNYIKGYTLWPINGAPLMSQITETCSIWYL